VPGRAPAPAAAAGPGDLGYEVVLEPSNQRWLLALETPVRWSGTRASLTGNRQLITMEPITERIAYRARSKTVGAPPPENPVGQSMRAAMSLPAGSNPRAFELAQRLRAGRADDRAFLASALRLFHDEPFQYTLTPPRLGRHAVDEFLFGTRQGFCEHYASAFAFLARAGGVPARVVAGYQGAERNPFSDYWIVRQANAHAWVEVWLDGAWHRYDPTSAVAPERITDGMSSGLLRARFGEDRLWRTNLFLNRVVLSWDAVNAAWDRWVLAFGPETQADLLLRLGLTTPDSLQLLALCAVAAACCLLALALAIRRQFGAGTDAVSRLYATACGRIGRVIRPRLASETPEAYARVVHDLRPDLGPELEEITALYLRLRYLPSENPALARALARRVRRFRPGLARDRARRAAARHRPRTG
jgi:transglutaminase-like putative cysteine protease